MLNQQLTGQLKFYLYQCEHVLAQISNLIATEKFAERVFG